MRVKFVGGPMHGTEQELPDTTIVWRVAKFSPHAVMRPISTYEEFVADLNIAYVDYYNVREVEVRHVVTHKRERYQEWEVR